MPSAHVTPSGGAWTRLARAALALVLLSVTQHAQAADAAADQLENGHTALAGGHQDIAYDLYRDAFRKARRFDTAANLGLVELDLGKFRDAAEHLEAATRGMPEEVDAALRGRIQQGLATAKKKVGAIQLSVAGPNRSAGPDGAVVTVDGKQVGTTPLAAPIFVEPGKHVIVVSKGGVEASATYTVAPGQDKLVALELDAPPEGAQLGGGQAAIITTGALLSAAGLGLGAALLYGSIQRGADADAKETELFAAHGKNDCDARPELCAEIGANESARDELRVGAIVGFSVGGALAAGTILYTLIGTGSPTPATGKPEQAYGVQPALGPGMAGATITWRF